MPELTPNEIEEAKRQAWLEKRRKCITSTDVAILFGEGYSGTSPSLLFAQKTGRAPDVSVTEKMEWGLLLEDDIAEMYYRKTGVPVRLTDPYNLTIHPDYPRFGTTLDGYDAEDMLLEMKNTEEWVKEQDEDTLFMGWRIQAQWQMFCTGRKNLRIVACVRGCHLVTVDQERDDDFLEVARTRAEAFIHALDSDTPPAPSVPEDDDAMKYLWTPTKDKAVQILDPDVISILDERDVLKEQLDALTKQKKMADARLKDHMRDAEVAILEDGTKLTWKADKNGRRSFRRSKAKRGS